MVRNKFSPKISAGSAFFAVKLYKGTGLTTSYLLDWKQPEQLIKTTFLANYPFNLYL